MNRTFTNLTSLVGADTAGRLLGLVAVAFLARTVGAEALGLLAAGMGILTYGTIVAEAGLPMLGTRKVARDMSAPQALIRQVCITRAALASGVFILCGAALFLTLNTASLRNLIIVYLLALFPSVFVIEWVFQGLKKITVLAGGRIITAFTYLLWLVLFVRQDSSLLLVPVGWITSVIAQAIYLWKQLETTDQQESQAGVSSSELLKTAWPLGLAGLIAQTVIQFPAVYLGVTDPYAGGLFNIAFRVIVLMLVVDRVFYTLFFPAITSVLKSNPSGLSVYFSRTMKLMVFATVYIAVAAVVSSRHILPFLFGNDFVESTVIFQLLTLYFVCSVINSVCTFTLIGAEREKVYLNSLMLGGAGFFGIMLLPGPVPSSHLAAMGLVIFQLISFLVMLREIQAFIQFPVGRIIFLPIVSGLAVMTVLAQLYSLFPLFSLILAITATPIILYFVAGISPEDRTYAMRALS
tara:strand:- start:9275 stop:10669 length:1395 start_codon:yes stop_codon:yes gene_type:complete